MNTVAILGSNSFSGATFAAHALAQGWRVLGISRSPEPVAALLPYRWQDHAHWQFAQLDLNHDLPGIVDLIRDSQARYVVNFAAQSMVEQSWQHPGDWMRTNAVATIELHDALRKLGTLERYVHVSTPEVYGSCSGFVGEDHPFNPSTPYAVSRAAADMSLRCFHSAYGFPVVSTRAANVYGPGQQLYRIIPRTILSVLLGKRLQLHGGGSSTRSFIHMRDVCDATWRIMRGGRNGQTYHISTPQVISVRDLVQRICDKLDVEFAQHVDVVGERLGKDAAYHLDSTRVRIELEWNDHIGLDQGLDECIAWARQHLDTLQNLPLDYQHKP